MKTLKVSILSLFMLVCIGSAQAQNNSADNSNVMLSHEWFYFTEQIVSCGYIIDFEGTVQEVVKILPNGTFTVHYNAYGEGTDQHGGVWKWHDNWNAKYGQIKVHENGKFVLQGPKGVKLEGRLLMIINGSGKLVQTVFEVPPC